jgi:hypothetical protein
VMDERDDSAGVLSIDKGGTGSTGPAAWVVFDNVCGTSYRRIQRLYW